MPYLSLRKILAICYAAISLAFRRAPKRVASLLMMGSEPEPPASLHMQQDTKGESSMDPASSGASNLIQQADPVKQHQAADGQEECWHEVVVSTMKHPQDGRWEHAAKA